MEPLTTYQGTWLNGSYRFDLFPDALRVAGSTYLHSDEDATIALKDLQVRVDRLRVRSTLFTSGMWLFCFGMVAYPLAVSAFNLDPFGYAAGLLGTAGVTGLVMTLAAARKTEFARLLTDAGVVAVLIPRTRASEDFDKFVNRVVAQIRECKGLVGSTVPTVPPQT